MDFTIAGAILNLTKSPIESDRLDGERIAALVSKINIPNKFNDLKYLN